MSNAPGLRVLRPLRDFVKSLPADYDLPINASNPVVSHGT
jgi:hypothetical protein